MVNMTDHDPDIRDAFEGDGSTITREHQDRLWTAMQRRQTRLTRRRYIARAGVVLLAGASVGGLFALRNASRSSAAAAVRDAAVIAADSTPGFSPSEQSLIQSQPQLLPLLEQRSSLQMDVARYEAQIDALGRRLNTTWGAERSLVDRQLREAERQLDASRSALGVVDRVLTGRPGTVSEYSSVAIAPSPPIIVGSPFASAQEVMYVAGGLGGGLLLLSLALLMYMRRIARTTRESLAQVVSQISSQHATLASGIDAVALEVERLGEGQRFMSRVLSKGEPQSRDATT
jgi:hypothetical protein